MEFVAHFDMDGAAFADDQVLEVNQCLARIAEQRIADPTLMQGPVRDTNGNTVGRWSITGL